MMLKTLVETIGKGHQKLSFVKTISVVCSRKNNICQNKPFIGMMQCRYSKV